MISFIWSLSETGYSWDPLPNGNNNPRLVPLKPWPTREYEPLRLHTGLFRQFAELTEESDAIIRFANEFGPLCRPSLLPEKGMALSISAKAGKGYKAVEPNRPLQGPQETLAFWREQILAMRSAIVLWDGIRKERVDPAELASVAESIELRCRGRVESHFLFERSQRKCEWIRLPHDLIGAIWLQLSDAVAGSKQYRRCPAPNCGKWFELPTSARGPTPNHCSAACKQRMHRLRRQVEELSEKKRTPNYIARQLGVPVQIVKQLVTDTSQDGGSDSEGNRPGLDL